MSFNANNSINLSNYEEWLLLYTDGELQPVQVDAVDAFLQLHPQLLPELEALLATKLPADEAILFNKEALLSPAMKAAVVHENLLLYVDDELPAEQRLAVESRLVRDEDYALQYRQLKQTKVDASEIVSYPNKAELYRHVKRAVFFRPWMRVAAAVMLLLLGSAYFLVNEKKGVTPADTVATAPVQIKPSTPVIEDRQNGEDSILKNVNGAQPVQQSVATAQQQVKRLKKAKPDDAVKSLTSTATPDVALQQQSTTARPAQLLLVKSRQSTVAVALNPINKTITPIAVTTALSQPYNRSETTQDVALSGDGSETKKKTPARGFFRKVSRFIERRTGIGTVNADNELVIGAVALKLK